ncbi:hypothetical protein G6652_04920 [Polynucleobacter paneuropaeus]|jgi:hypothetical protein|nr:hypothetical protein [Polynucleobacter paneuropaeus]MBT8576704.1 hypothetical protein [Polynucleobacter paneuropaeus]MBT8615097.1 hypothetical protein [Polynucleobacter paneuropaeus]MBT8616578.1 hypothetical protein [Polynucleobacter paneuropaeus]MBT8618459.1 hypothetical protein [Polynucleobacter paneuropaeus]
MKKIIYVSFSKLTDRIIRDYYITDFISAGFEIEYWDIIPLVRESHFDAGEINPGYLKTFLDWDDLENNIIKNKNQIFWMIVSYNYKFSRIYRIFSKYNVKMVYMVEGNKPISPNKKKIFNIIWWANNFNKYINIVYLKFIAYYEKLFGLVNPYEIVFTSGLSLQRKANFARNVVPINSVDYDHFFSLTQRDCKLQDGAYSVYLDTYLPFHHDHAVIGRPYVEKEQYYLSLNRFFHRHEVETGSKVIIAAHPTAIYDKNPFNGRKILRLKTAELVKYANFVIADCSTSIAYAVLFKKPLIFIFDNQIISLYKNDLIMNIIQSYAKYLSATLLNVDGDYSYDFIKNIKIDEKKYKSYKMEFLTNELTCNESNFSIIKRRILELAIK